MRFGVSKPRKKRRISRTQACLAALGAIVICIGATILAIESANGADQASLSAKTLRIDHVGGAREVTIEVENDGGRTASEVSVSAQASGEEAAAVIDYVPAGGGREVVVRLEAAGPVEVRVDSWIYP